MVCTGNYECVIELSEHAFYGLLVSLIPRPFSYFSVIH